MKQSVGPPVNCLLHNCQRIAQDHWHPKFS
uniref:Uncharacterized protein n=1 Tax=Rhizophora mucronata TaxID=61149 RepID=A0A2P2QRQ9_RHIMU